MPNGAFEQEGRARQHQQMPRHACVARAAHLRHAQQHFAERPVAKRLACIVLHQGLDAAPQCGPIGRRGQHSQIEVGVQKPVAVLPHERQHEGDEVQACAAVEVADEAEVVEADAPIREHEQVARMRVAVKHAFDDQLPQVGVDEVGREQRALRGELR